MSESATAQDPRAVSFDEWAALPEDDTRELVDGALVEDEVPEYVHELVVAWLIRMLGAWGAPRGALVAGSGAKFKVTPKRGRMPDVTVYLRDARKPPRRGVIDTPPSIAIEVISATPRDERLDRIEKMSEYATFGIKWYWLVDPELRTFEVLELGGDGRYVHAASASEGRMEQVPGCQELDLDLDELWREVDALEG